MVAPMVILEDEAELGQRDRKQYIRSNGQKSEASRVGVKSVYEEWLLQWQNK